MKLSKEQKDLLLSLSTNYTTGPTNSLEQDDDDDQQHHDDELNIINPPLNCPKWACIVLPCINHIPSMKLFKKIIPREAEVRLGQRWVCYDASSLNKGDIVRLNEGDIVPADVRLLNLGLDFVSENENDEHEHDGHEHGGHGHDHELIIDSSLINGRTKPQTITLNDDGTVDAVELYAGSVVLQGEAIVVVTKIGGSVLLSTLIRDGKWPPKPKEGWEVVNQNDDEVV